nr:unnamed protein product [Spirometra erinaceieuropaei]
MWIRSLYSAALKPSTVRDQQFAVVDVRSGVPQGSVLGLTLFLVYVNDCTNELDCDIAMFADDIKIWSTIRSEVDEARLQTNLGHLEQWSKDWLLPFNVNKCNFLRVGVTSSPNHTVYHLTGKPLQVIDDKKDLGVWITTSLKPSLQCSKAGKTGQLATSSDIKVKSLRLRPEKEVYLSDDVIFYCEVAFKSSNGFRWTPSCPLIVRFFKKGKVYNYTGFPAKNVRLIYVDKPEKVEVICYADGKRTPPKIIKYKGVKTPPSFSLVPHKPSYHVGDLITSCQISQEDEKKEVDCPFYMEVIDSITKEVIWDTSSFVTTAEIPWIMQEVPSELQVTCRGQESDVGPRHVKVNRTDILLAKPPSLSVVNDGDVAKCIGAIFKQVTNITWVYISGERQRVVGRKMYIRAGKLPETVKTPRTTTYACVGYVGKRLVSITVKYKIASLLSLKIYPQLEMCLSTSSDTFLM